MQTDWIQDEVLRGLQKLLALSLDRTPASELLPITVGTWVEVITMGREFDEGLDIDRFRQAFKTLAATRTTWPAPRDFIEAMPARQQLALAKTALPANPERVAEAIAQAKELLGIPDGKKAAAGPDA